MFSFCTPGGRTGAAKAGVLLAEPQPTSMDEDKKPPSRGEGNGPLAGRAGGVDSWDKIELSADSWDPRDGAAAGAPCPRGREPLEAGELVSFSCSSGWAGAARAEVLVAEPPLASMGDKNSSSSMDEAVGPLAGRAGVAGAGVTCGVG